MFHSLDISYTKAPSWVKMIPDYEHDQSATFWSLARLGFPEERAKSIGDARPSPTHQVTLDPDEHMLCYDYLYYVCAQQVRVQMHLEAQNSTFRPGI